MQRLLSSLTVLALLTSPALYAQAPCALKKDINTSPLIVSSFPNDDRALPGNTLRFGSFYVRCGAFWFFTASCTTAGRELYRTDGTAAGTVMVKDINPGPSSSSPISLICCRFLLRVRPKKRRP